MENLIKNEEILKNIIILNNLIEDLIEHYCGKLGINFMEFSILSYISNNDATQYEISKEYEISIQRINQIITKLEKGNCISKTEVIRNGKLIKKLKINLEIQNEIKVIQNILVEIGRTRVDTKNLNIFKDSLKILVRELKSTNNSIIDKK